MELRRILKEIEPCVPDSNNTKVRNDVLIKISQM